MINVLGWCLSGLVIGWAAHRFSDKHARGALTVYLASSVMGATLGGMIVLIFEARPLDNLSAGSLITAMLSALLLAGLARLLIRQLL